MSYSFQVKGATKALALAAAALAMADVVKCQPIHASDERPALAAAETFVNILPDDESKDVAISMNGYLSWQGEHTDPQFVGAAVTVNASLIARE